MSETLVQLGRPSTVSTGRREGRPEWLRVRLATPASYHHVRNLVDRLSLHTVCQEARCPNIYECWGQHGTATFMILGDVCTRRCGFCAVTSGKPAAGVDSDEPRRVAEAVHTMELRHAAIRELNPETAVEVLTPDFKGVGSALDIVLTARPEVFSHNMETVPRLYRE